VPVMRLRQELTAYELKTYKGQNLRDALAKRMRQMDARNFESGFAAGRAARLGPPPTGDVSTAWSLPEEGEDNAL